ncbi:MAG: trehalase family glycosidase [Pseudomonadota bacterium]
MSQEMIAQARAVLARNDKGGYTVPTHGLYPFQWNWDSALSALGFAQFDEARAWTEIDTLMAHQWDDGMVPHIIFHEEDSGYFPGPNVWGTNRPVPTSGITQPPVAGFAVRRNFERATDAAMATQKARALLPKLHAWHKWFYDNRDPHGTGLVAVIHPWETGRDNSADWDSAFARVPTEGVGSFTRRDTSHANPDHRPTDEQYKRYIWLVQTFRSLGWDNSKLHDASPFQIVDPGFNAILIRACSDVADLAEYLGATEIAAQSRRYAAKGIAAMETLWDEQLSQYLCYDRQAQSPVVCPTVGGILPAFCDIPKHRKAALVARIKKLADSCNYVVPSHDPTHPEFDGLRYWRGPVWLIVNFMIADGLDRAGFDRDAEHIRDDCLRLIRASGFAEYYDPITAEPCGGDQFTWTAAMVLEILNGRKVSA